jgi:hypothetical protein
MSLGGLHVVTGDFTSHRKFLSDEVYAEALDNFVKGCTDMLLTDSKGRILLGKRLVFPQPGTFTNVLQWILACMAENRYHLFYDCCHGLHGASSWVA